MNDSHSSEKLIIITHLDFLVFHSGIPSSLLVADIATHVSTFGASPKRWELVMEYAFLEGHISCPQAINASSD